MFIKTMQNRDLDGYILENSTTFVQKKLTKNRYLNET
jgi:hypothetical protein